MEDWTLLIVVTIIFAALVAAALMSWPPQPSPPDSHRLCAPSAAAPSLSIAAPAAPPTVEFSSPDEERHFIAQLLAQARSSLSAERPMQALSLVLAAVRQQRGEEGVFDALNAAREEYGLAPHANPVRQARERAELEHRRADADVDALMSGMSLRPAWTPYSMPGDRTRRAESRMLEGGDEDATMEEEDGGDDSDEGGKGDASVLEERGDGRLLDDAVRDGGRFATCARCRGVIARERMAQHTQLWCEADDPQHNDRQRDNA